MSLEAYSKYRKAHKGEVLEHREPAAREADANVTAERTRATVKVALVAKCENLKRGLFSQARRG